MRILVLNGGSSSFKCSLHEFSTEPVDGESPAKPLWESHINSKGNASVAAVLEPILAAVPRPVDVVGHRIVHGGSAFRESAVATPKVRDAIAQQADLAPAHNRLELAAMDTVDRVFGSAIRQVAVFDTAFHATLAPAAYVYPGPYEWVDAGIRRYGFHGISHQYSSRRAAVMLRRNAPSGELSDSLRLVTCHLGNGASLAAVHGGRSVDTTMGFTPLEGLMMGTRSGSIDPGIVVYLIRSRGYTADQLDRILNQESGLLGVSGKSGDMREILQAMALADSRAQLAFDIYAHRLVREIGAMVAVLGGVDALVFTGGIGENTPLLREAVCKQFGFLGIDLDAAKNAAPQLDAEVASETSKVRVLVIRAQEDWEIARECYRIAQ
jgi:acetate kinase